MLNSSKNINNSLAEKLFVQAEKFRMENKYKESIDSYLHSILINKNISLLIRSYGLDDSYKATLENGGVIEIKVNDQVVSAGIDLNEPSGIRTADGDIIAWQQDANADRLPKYSFGLFGCWVADDSNILTYVPEEKYDEDMEREFTRSAQANAAAQTMKMN